MNLDPKNLDELARNGIGYFFTDTHGILFGSPPPRFGVYAPVITHAGTASTPATRLASEKASALSCGWKILAS